MKRQQARQRVRWTAAQVRNQFFASVDRFRSLPAFAGWQWLETEIRNSAGGFLFGRATDTSGNIEGIHDQFESPAALLVDEAKTIADEILDALERCHTSYRLFMSSTGAAFGGFYQIMTAKAHLWRTFFRVSSDLCPHVSRAEIEADRSNLKDSVFAIKHDARFLYDSGGSMISLEHVRALLADPPAPSPGKVTAFCDFAGPGDESVLALSALSVSCTRQGSNLQPYEPIRAVHDLGPLTRSVCRWPISKRLKANARAARRYQSHFDTGKMVTRQGTCFGGDRKESVGLALSFERKPGRCKKVTKAVVGIHDLLTHSLFGDGNPRSLLPCVSRAKPTSVPLRF
jgi:hypothetical protein